MVLIFGGGVCWKFLEGDHKLALIYQKVLRNHVNVQLALTTVAQPEYLHFYSKVATHQ